MGKTSKTIDAGNSSSFFFVRGQKQTSIFSELKLKHNEEVSCLSLINIKSVKLLKCYKKGLNVGSLCVDHLGIGLDTEIVSMLLKKENFFMDLIKKTIPSNQKSCTILIPGTTIYHQGRECVAAICYKGDPTVYVNLYDKEHLLEEDFLYKIIYAK